MITPTWLLQLSAKCRAAAEGGANLPPSFPQSGTIQFRAGPVSYILRMEDGEVLAEDALPDAWIEGSSETIEAVVCGERNAQQVHALGEVRYGGNPDVLLQLAVVIKSRR